jgi:hypothetical protein
LIEGYGVLVEEQLDDLLKRLRERLLKQFDDAKLCVLSVGVQNPSASCRTRQ